MRIILTGANGQLAHDIRRVLADTSHEVVPLTRADIDFSNHAWTWPTEIGPFDALINTAAFHQVDKVEKDPVLAMQLNLDLPERLSNICETYRAHMVHISTDYVFGGAGMREAPYPETAVAAPINVYGNTKHMGEMAVRRQSPKWTVCRVASLFGVAGSSGKGGNFIETMLRKQAAGEPIKVVSDQIMSPTSTADAAGAIVRLVEERLLGIFHVVNSGDPASWYDLALAALAANKGDFDLSTCATKDMPTVARRPVYSALDDWKLTEVGLRLPPWQEAVERYIKARRLR